MAIDYSHRIAGQITYQKITTNVATNLTTAPHSNATDWLPCQFEIWKSNGSNTSSLPLYIRLTYTTAGAANNTQRQHIAIGTGIDSNGNITGGIPMSNSAPTNILNSDNSTTSSSVVAEMDFSGDADNIRWIAYRGHSTAIFVQTVVLDRAKNSAGVDTDAYVYCGTILLQGGGTLCRSCVLPNPAIGLGAMNPTNGSGWQGVVWVCANANPMNIYGSTPPLPIFPLIGFVANPIGQACQLSVSVWGLLNIYLPTRRGSGVLQPFQNRSHKSLTLGGRPMPAPHISPTRIRDDLVQQNGPAS
jgi:hypothetical protein